MLARHIPVIDMTITLLLHSADIVLGMTWLQAITPIIDWASGEAYISDSVSTLLAYGEWLQTTGKVGTIKMLSSREQLQELKHQRICEGLSTIETPQFWQCKKNKRELQTTSVLGSNYCTILDDATIMIGGK